MGGRGEKKGEFTGEDDTSLRKGIFRLSHYNAFAGGRNFKAEAESETNL